jgi:GxxExxY protein
MISNRIIKRTNDTELEKITSEVIDCIFKVHKTLGPGLLESAYETCLMYEIKKRGLKAIKQKQLPLLYDGIKLDAGYRIDILVEDKLILEIKAAESLTDVHLAQVITYLKLSENKLGLLVNFNVTLIKNGIKRVVL